MCFSAFFALSLCKQTFSRLLVNCNRAENKSILSYHVARRMFHLSSRESSSELFANWMKIGFKRRPCIVASFLRVPRWHHPGIVLKSLLSKEMNAHWRPPDLSGLLHDRLSINWHVSSACAKCCLWGSYLSVNDGNWTDWDMMIGIKKKKCDGCVRIWTCLKMQKKWMKSTILSGFEL